MILDKQTQALMEQIAKEAADKAVERTLITIGIDYSNPIETQKDMATLHELRVLTSDEEFRQDLLHLRKWRRNMERIESKGLMVAAGMVCFGCIAMILYAFKTKLI